MAPNSNKLSPYAGELKNYLATLPGTPSDAERHNAERKWMYWRLSNLQCGSFTIKTGQPVRDFVAFEDLNPSKYPQHDIAYAEAGAKKIPDLEEFYKLFAVMCHLNDKGSDPDKLCAPRHQRLHAIACELNNPGTMQAPEGFASDNKAGWTHEVKHGWKLSEDGFVAKKVGENKYAVVAPLEQAYITIAHAHVKTVSGQVKHFGRDVTQKNVREHDSTFPTQIIKDFVAACPGCNASPKRVARYNGTVTTRTNGGNRGQKQKKQLSTTPPIKRSRSESLDNDNSDYAPEEAAKKPRISSTNVAHPAQGSIMRNNLYPTVYYCSPERGYSVQPYNLTRPTDFEHPSQMNQEFNLPQGIFGANNLIPYNRSVEFRNSTQPSYNTPPTYGQAGNFTDYNNISQQPIYEVNNNYATSIRHEPVNINPLRDRVQALVAHLDQNLEGPPPTASNMVPYNNEEFCAALDFINQRDQEAFRIKYSTQQVQFHHDAPVQGFGSTDSQNVPPIFNHSEHIELDSTVADHGASTIHDSQNLNQYQPTNSSNFPYNESSLSLGYQELGQHLRDRIQAFMQQDALQEYAQQNLAKEEMDFMEKYANTDDVFDDAENYAFNHRVPTPEIPKEDTTITEQQQSQTEAQISEEVKPKEQLPENNLLANS